MIPVLSSPIVNLVSDSRFGRSLGLVDHSTSLDGETTNRLFFVVDTTPRSLSAYV